MSQTITAPPTPSVDWQASLRLGYITLFLVVGVFGSWAAFAHIDAAVVAVGTFSVESNRKTIQHLEGGIVREILVRDGDRVTQGQVLMRLDPTRFEATATATGKGLANALATEARLVAQRDMADHPTFPAEIATLLDPGSGSSVIDDNRRQFESRREVLARALEVLENQSKQTGNEIAQARLDLRSASDQVVSVVRELDSVRPLLAKGLVALSRVTTLERQKLQYDGAIDKAKNDIQKGEDKVAEIAIRIAGLKQDYRQEAANALIDVGKQIADMRQQRQIALDMYTRSDIRAPVDGTVQQLRIFTVGGVVRPGEPIVDIVPDSNEFVVKAKVPPGEIDRLTQGMPAEVRMNSLTRFLRQQVKGELRFVSRDVITDANPNIPPYYSVEVSIKRDEVPEEIRDKLQAGMDAMVVIPTQGRTVLKYLIQPITDNFEASLHER